MTRMGVFTRHGSGLPSFVAHQGTILCMAMSPDGRVLVTGGEEPGVVRFWNTQWYGLIRELHLPVMGHEIGFRTRHAYDEVTYDALPRFVTAADWSPSGRRLAVACGGYVFVIGGTSHSVLRRIGPHKGQVTDVRWLGTTEMYVGTVCLDSYQRNWPAAKKKAVEHPGRTVHPMVVRPRVFAPSANNWWAFVGGGEGGCLLGHMMTEVVTLKTSARGIEAAGWGVDQRSVYTVDYGGVLRVFDTEGLCIAPEVQLHDTMARCMAKPRHSSLAATGDEGGVVKVWHEGLGVLAELQGHAGSVRCMAATQNFEALYTAGEDGVIRGWTQIPVHTALRAARAKIAMDEPELPPEGERNLEV